MGNFRGVYLYMIRNAPWRPRIARIDGAYENAATAALALSPGRGYTCVTLSMLRPTLQIEANNRSGVRVEEASTVGRMRHRSHIPMSHQFHTALPR